MSSYAESLLNKTVWLTGASSGIGEALAHELAGRGARVAISARREAELNNIAKEIEARGQMAKVFPADVCKLDELQSTVKKIEGAFGPIDIVLANAGSHVFTEPENFDSDEYLQLMDLNFGGMLRTIEAALPNMLSRKSGRIVGVASLAGFRGLPRAAAYGASKAAQIHFLESIRYHLEEHSLRVTIVNPGFVKTPLTDKNDFYMPFLLDAKHAAEIICDGIERDKKEISFPIPFSWFMKIMRIVPYPLHEFLARILWKMM